MDCPVDEWNLSFSDDDDMASIFITQSSSRDVSTQQVNDAIEFLDGLEDGSLSELLVGEKNDLKEVIEQQRQDAMCEKVFDFSDDYDNSYTVSTQDNPIIVTRKSDGKVFTVGNGKPQEAEHIIEINSALPAMYDAEHDLKCFKSIVSNEELMAIKNKRFMFYLHFASFLLSV